MPISQKIARMMENSSWIRRMFETGNELRRKDPTKPVYDFTLGNPTSEPPAKFREVLRETALSDGAGAHRYMSNNGYLETRELVAAAMRKASGVEVGAEHVVMTVGAAGALNITLKSILEPGDEVMYLAPFFPEYGFYVDNHQGVCRIVESAPDFSIDFDEVRKGLNERTKAFILNSPNNPTGVIYSEKNLRDLADLLRKHKAQTGRTVYVISDEPYRKLVYGQASIPQTLAIFDDIIFCTSHSKDLGLPGERIGYAIVGPHTEDAKNLLAAMIFSNRVLGFVNAPAIMQRVVGHLQGETVDLETYRVKRDTFYNGLREAGYDLVEPRGAFYLFPRCPVEDDVLFANRMIEHRVLVVPGSGFGRAGYFRLSYCVDLETIRDSLPVFAEVLHELKA